MSQECRLKKNRWNKNHFLEKLEQNELISKKHKKFCTTLNYSRRFLILASTITGYILIYAFATLLGISIGITSSTIVLKICAIATGMKKYNSIIKKK